MTNKHNGGPAFPRPAGDYNGTKHGNYAQVGISMRDYFAAKAMQAIVTHEDMWEQPNSAIAKYAYDLADAMLEQREK